MSVIGKNILKYREKMKMTQDELGDLLGRSGNAISQWENGQNKPNADMIIDMLSIFNIDANTFFSWDELKRKKSDEPNLYYIISNDESGEIRKFPASEGTHIFLSVMYPPEALEEIEAFIKYINVKYKMEEA